MCWQANSFLFSQELETEMSFLIILTLIKINKDHCLAAMLVLFFFVSGLPWKTNWTHNDMCFLFSLRNYGFKLSVQPGVANSPKFLQKCVVWSFENRRKYYFWWLKTCRKLSVDTLVKHCKYMYDVQWLTSHSTFATNTQHPSQHNQHQNQS